ncbi:MAG: DUF47 family protein [Oscillospiraceae bacterium]|nr:DUF47 family protein [Oscillospiraceae bacterium]
MAKGDKFYFENFAESTALSKKAADYFAECLENYDPSGIQTMLNTMHNIEHSADMKKHEMNEALAKAFVTPVDREDLDLLSHKLDDITDTLEEVLQKFYIFNIQKINSDAIAFARKIVKACELLCEIMNEFENFKKSKKIHALIVKINEVEEECDVLYLSSMRKLILENQDVMATISWREIYECLEACADACENVSECVGSVIMKNT